MQPCGRSSSSAPKASPAQSITISPVSHDLVALERTIASNIVQLKLAIYQQNCQQIDNFFELFKKQLSNLKANGLEATKTDNLKEGLNPVPLNLALDLSAKRRKSIELIELADLTKAKQNEADFDCQQLAQQAIDADKPSNAHQQCDSVPNTEQSLQMKKEICEEIILLPLPSVVTSQSDSQTTNAAPNTPPSSTATQVPSPGSSVKPPLQAQQIIVPSETVASKGTKMSTAALIQKVKEEEDILLTIAPLPTREQVRNRRASAKNAHSSHVASTDATKSNGKDKVAASKADPKRPTFSASETNSQQTPKGQSTSKESQQQNEHRKGNASPNVENAPKGHQRSSKNALSRSASPDDSLNSRPTKRLRTSSNCQAAQELPKTKDQIKGGAMSTSKTVKKDEMSISAKEIKSSGELASSSSTHSSLASSTDAVFHFESASNQEKDSTEKQNLNKSTTPSCSESKNSGHNNADIESPWSSGNKYRIEYLKCFLKGCPKTKLKSLNEMTMHLRQVHKKGTFKCQLYQCGKWFNSSIKLDNHYKVDHSGVLKWRCDECSKIFDSCPQLKRHCTLLHQLGSYVCEGCDFKTTSRGAVLEHYTREHVSKPSESLLENGNAIATTLSEASPVASTNQSDTIFDDEKMDKRFSTQSVKCTNCEQHFQTTDLMGQHLQEAHGVLAHQCPKNDCSMPFPLRTSLIEHCKSKHSDVTEWQCLKCTEHFANVQLFLEHQTFAHQEGSFTCAQCSFAGKFRAEIAKHFDREHGVSGIKQSAAPPVGKSAHQSVSTLQKYNMLTVRCTNCEEWFLTPDAMAQHLGDRHDIALYRCPVYWCNVPFKRRFSLAGHMRAKHGNAGMWQCFVCLAMFYDGAILSEHIATGPHSGPFADSLFHSQRLMRDHLAGAFGCTRCPLKSKFRYEILKHFDEKHGSGCAN